ncbi:Anthranilate synthase [Thermaerobacter marianensis DSM 12885]|uniref:Anthranilate synthase component 1 n=1 Tax=Thermaerobacter marianensis (strain ATCC 700841 / DSM 12885 / JCM 10246 / 7p75a) TaxID=644966 RepID=E6SGB7_THEM7|nr:anthranilate synthase component I family protein [Thermaerobacter marianensis]ADU51569.1 Anthranilate synthase [Thermaerobacter marianensis DSM 12885]
MDDATGALVLELALDQETPVTLFRRLAGDGPGFILESLGGGERSGRYSYVGVMPLRELVCTGSGSAIYHRDEPGGAVVDVTPGPADPFEALRQFVPRRPVPAGLRFAGGAVGYVGYDAVRFLERLPARPPADPLLPVARFMECALLAVLDHVTHRLRLIAPLLPVAAREGNGAEGGPRTDSADGAGGQATRAALRRLETALGRLAEPLPPRPPIFLDGAGTAAPAGGGRGGLLAALRSNVDRETFLAAVRQAQGYIRAGDAFQVVLSRRFEFPWPGALAEPEVPSDLDLYRALRVVSPSPYMFFLRFDRDTTLLGASPELLVRVEGRRALTRPLAGTRRRGATDDEDQALERELLADPKERAEHTMLVDLGRNDLGRVCRPGTVRVQRLMYVERYSHVMHLASDVTGELADGRDAVDALAACFPAGTLTGAPKVRAMEIIDELEPVARGPYGGAVGYLGYNGDLDMCIAIRTLVLHRGRGFLQVGAGVVAGSRPEAEWEETEAKARSGLRALALALGGLGRRGGPGGEGTAAGGGSGIAMPAVSTASGASDAGGRAGSSPVVAGSGDREVSA